MKKRMMKVRQVGSYLMSATREQLNANFAHTTGIE